MYKKNKNNGIGKANEVQFFGVEKRNQKMGLCLVGFWCQVQKKNMHLLGGNLTSKFKIKKKTNRRLILLCLRWSICAKAVIAVVWRVGLNTSYKPSATQKHHTFSLKHDVCSTATCKTCDFTHVTLPIWQESQVGRFLPETSDAGRHCVHHTELQTSVLPAGLSTHHK